MVEAIRPFGDGSCEIKLWNLGKALIDELHGRFPNHELISTLGVIYENFWAQNFDNVGDHFHWCLIVIKVACCCICKVGKNGVWVKLFLDGHLLDSQYSFCKLIGATNNELVLKKVSDFNPMTQS
jgi:hypothetical protein